MDVSHLQVKVSGEGIAETSRKLSGLGVTASNVEAKVSKLTEQIGKLIGVNTRLGASQQTATAAANAQAAAFVNLQTISGQIAHNMMAMMTVVSQLNSQLTTLQGSTGRVAQGFEHKAKWGNVVVSTLKAMTTAAVTYAAINLGKSVVTQADAWQLMNARLQVATKSSHNAIVAQQQIFDLSQQLRVPLEDTTRLYTRLAPAMAKMGKDSGQTREMVEGVATALKLSGATGAEAASVMLQFSQSVNAGRLNGAEFNAVAEAAPKILEALETATGKNRDQLKKLGAEGKLSIELIQKSMQAVLPQWREDFAKLPVTFEDAIVRLKNAWTRAMGEMGQDTGFNQELNKALGVVERMIPAVAQGLAKAFIEVMKWLDKNKESLKQIWEQLLLILKDAWNVGTAIGSWSGAIVAAGEDFNVIAFTIFSLRLFLAGVVDGVKLIGATATMAGTYIADFMLYPVKLVAAGVEKIIEGLKAVADIGAKAARFAGLEKTAEFYEQQAATLQGYGASVKAFYATVDGIGDSARATAKSLFSDLANGKGAVQDVLNGVLDLSVKARGAVGAYQENFTKGGKGSPDEKALAAAKKAADSYTDSLNGLNQKIREQQELAQRLSQAGLNYDKISEGTKQRIKYEEELRALQERGASKLEQDRTAILLVQALELEAYEKKNERTIELLRLQKLEQDAATSKMKTLEEEAKAIERKVETYGMARGAIEALEEAETRAEVERMERLPARTAHEEAMLAILKQQLEYRTRIANASGDLGALEAATNLDKMLDSNKAIKFGNDFKASFDKAGKAIGGVMDAFERMNQRQAKTNKMREEYNKLVTKDAAKAASYAERIRDEEAKDTIDGMADMTAAAKGFFDEKSKGYKALENAEKAFRIFEMALEMKSFATKIGNLLGITTARQAADTVATTSAVTSATAQVAANQAVSASNAVTGVTNQSKGDPYTAFPRMAAMAAIMAALGFAVGFSGKGGATAPTTNTGTGTVFGDSSAKSASIENSIERLTDIDAMTMRYSAQMAASLANIEASLGGVANLLIRNPNISSAGNLGITTGTVKQSGDPFGQMTGDRLILDTFKLLDNLPLIGNLVGKIQSLWGSVKQEIVGSGVLIGGALSDLREGRGFSQYADIKTTKKKHFGLSKDESYSTVVSGLDPELANQFGMVLDQMAEAVLMAGQALGGSMQDITSRLAAVQLNIGRIDLRGLNGDQIKERLMAVFGAAGDTIAKAVLPGLEDFQKIGEGYLETVVRVSTSVEQARYELEKLGMSAIGLQQIVNKQGDVATEMVRQAILLNEAGTGVGEIISLLSGSASDLAEAYSRLVSVRRALADVGLGNNLTSDLVRAAGGLDSLQDALESYTEGFFSEAEQHAFKASELGAEFAKLGLVMPATKQAFRSLVDSVKASGNDSLAVRIILLSEAFSDLMESVSDSQAENIERVTAAREALSSAYERESSALEDVRDKFLGFAETLRDFRESLLLGELSPLPASDKLALLRDKFTATSSAALSGDEQAIAKFQEVAQEFLQFSREFNASSTQYVDDFNTVLAVTTQLEQMSIGQASIAEQQLVQMEAQVSALITINESVLTVAQAIANLQLISGVDGSHADGLSYVPFDGYKAELHAGERVLTAAENRQYSGQNNSAVADEIKALRAEISQLRQQQASETTAIIGANAEVTRQAAEVVVDGVKEAADAAAYVERSKVGLV